MKKIKTKILVGVVSPIVCCALILCLISSYMSYNSTISTLETTLKETVSAVSSDITNQLAITSTIARDIGCIARLAKVDTTTTQKRAIAQERCDMYNLKDIMVSDAMGNASSLINTKRESIADTLLYKAAMQGKTHVSEPIIYSDGTMDLYFSAPLWEGGLNNTKVIGTVIVVMDGNLLSTITGEVKVGNSGAAFIIDGKGTTIAHNNKDLVLGHDNTIANAKSNTALAGLAAYEEKMLLGETDFGEYTYGGVTKLFMYAPIADTNGWSLAINANKSEFTLGMYTAILWTAIAAGILVLIGIFLALNLANGISRPIISCAKRLELLTQGDLHTVVPTTTSKDETKLLLNSLDITINRFQTVVEDMSKHMGALAEGNLTTRVTSTYDGDFVPLGVSMKKILLSLNSAMSQINVASNQVGSGSEQVAISAQALSQGATEQAASIEELSSTIEEVSAQIRNNAENAAKANELAVQSADEVERGNSEMRLMIAAMEQISTASSEIGKIIKTIDDIAFQTNILALNAAVEAARAGAAGKGFAVVADEVRNLSGKSAEAAKNTTALIENAIKAVENGMTLAGRTADSLSKIVDITQQTSKIITKISSASDKQATDIGQVTYGVEKISDVVQNNSATAEQSAAASEELSSQAQLLKQMVARFELREDTVDLR